MAQHTNQTWHMGDKGEQRNWVFMHQRGVYIQAYTVYPKKYAQGFVVLCFVVVMQSFIMNSHEVFIHIHQGCFAGTGAIVRLPQCQWSKPDGYGKISQCITTTKHSKAKTVCIFLGIYCRWRVDGCVLRQKALDNRHFILNGSAHLPDMTHGWQGRAKELSFYASKRCVHSGI